MQKLYSAGIIVYQEINNKSQEYLLLHYPHGHWDLPKGKIENGETKKEAAIRELQEETGLNAHLLDGFEESISYIFTDHAGQLIKKTVYFFVGKALSSIVKLSYEHIGYAWLPFDAALDRLTYKNAKEILNKAQLFLSNL